MADQRDRCWLAHIDRSHDNRFGDISLKLRLFRISCVTLCKLWRALTIKAQSNHNPSVKDYFLSPGAETLLDVVMRSRRWPWQRCRIDLIGRSDSRVYAVFPPNRSSDEENAIAVKMVPAERRLRTEIKALKKIAPVFGEKFYALGYYRASEKRVRWFLDQDDDTNSRGENGDTGHTQQAWFYDGTLCVSPLFSCDENISLSSALSSDKSNDNDHTDDQTIVGALLMRLGAPAPHNTDSSAMLRDLTHALGEIHRAGVVHCDVRPCNVMYFGTTRGFQLIDFDLARTLNKDTGEVLLDDVFFNNGQTKGFPPSKRETLSRTGAVAWRPIDDVNMLYYMLAKDYNLSTEDILRL